MKISIELYLKRLSSDLKIEGLYATVEPKHFQISISGIEKISIHELENEIQISSHVGNLIENLDEEKTYSYLLYANFLGQGTGRSVLGIHPDDKKIILSQVIFFDIDYQNFKEIVEEYINYVDYLKGHLEEKIPTFLKEI